MGILQRIFHIFNKQWGEIGGVSTPEDSCARKRAKRETAHGLEGLSKIMIIFLSQPPPTFLLEP